MLLHVATDKETVLKMGTVETFVMSINVRTSSLKSRRSRKKLGWLFSSCSFGLQKIIQHTLLSYRPKEQFENRSYGL